MSFGSPWALLLLLLPPLTAAMGYARLQRLPGRRPLIALALRMAVLSLLAVALAQPQWAVMEQRVSTVFLVDTSASVGQVGQHAALNWVGRAVDAQSPHDQAGLVLFGAAPRLAVPLAHYKTWPDPADQSGGATDIGAALRLGLSVLPPGESGRLVLLSDGQDTGDAGGSGVAGATALALARGVPIDTVPLAPLHLRDVAVRALSVPASVRQGDRAPLSITLYSGGAAHATLTLWIDGAPASQAIDLPAGTTILRTEEPLDTVGLHTFRVQLTMDGDAVPQNNTLDAATVVVPPGHVLFAVSDPTAATALAKALARAHLSVTPMLASDLPATTAGYRAYDGVVLDDVPATELSTAQQKALRDAVRADGLGLLAVGGSSSFGEGNYTHTPLEDALPVLSIASPRRVSAPLALMLVIDKSGSMSDLVAGVAKIDMVKVAAASALDRLAEGDAVGVLAFDDSNHWIVPFHTLQGAADKAHIRKQISQLTGDGDTYIYPALRAAESAVLSVPTIYRHVVLLTDGQGEDAPFDTLIKRMHREHITLSTIGVGQDVVQDELRHWAQLGGGLFHYVSDPHDIPRIIINETRYGISGTAQVKGKIHLGVGTASPLLRAVANQRLPDIGAYDSTMPKQTAQVAVQSASGDPILSSWQYGLGRVVAWTSDALAANTPGVWAAQWSPDRKPDFWADLVRWSLRGYDPGSRVPTLSAVNGQLHVSVALRTASGAFDDSAEPRARVVMPDGTVRVLPLDLSGPGLYAADLPLAGQGVYSASFVRNDRGTSSPADVAMLTVPYPPEYAGKGVDTAFLTHLAAATGGSVLTSPADAFSHAGIPATRTWLPLWPWLLGLILLLFTADVAVRLLVPPDTRYI